MYKAERDGILTVIARFIKYHKVLIGILVVFLVIAVYSLFSDKGLLTRIRMKREKEKLSRMIEEEKKKQDSLKKEIELLNTSDKKIEKIAREKYGMTKEGEIIYKIEVDSTK
ncbi:MAG: septum formation initiator family protein [Ignavibacteria bacterium]|jgi:cell division protein FtsB|nr:septum formation initiator family protein [Ignavibacteria bacterium]